MGADLFFRGGWIGLLACFIVWGVSAVHNRRKDLFGHRIFRFCASWHLPSYLLAYPLVEILLFNRQEPLKEVLPVLFGLFVHLSLYYAILLPLLPRLRKRISAYACALLWTVPNYLYFYIQREEYRPVPLWVLRPSETLLRILSIIWLTGFAAVLLWNIFSHLAFRRRILRDARKVEDSAILAIWDSEWDRSTVPDMKTDLRISPAVRTPLSIGLFPGTTCVVLPDQPYSEQDLALIFRHEILHILQEDTWAKLFFAFCTALCWFNPFLWIAMRKSAEDLELSCDEAVLEDAGEEDRRRYASLILSTAGDSRGFTTCLSASAEALRYRLKRIMQPRSLRSGALTVALIFVVLGMTSGFVAISYASGTGEDLIFRSHEPESIVFSGSDRVEDSITYRNRKCLDEAALYGYFSSLTLDQITGGSTYPTRGRRDYFYYELPEGRVELLLTENRLLIRQLYGGYDSEAYYLPEDTDWDYIDSLFSDTGKTDSSAKQEVFYVN